MKQSLVKRVGLLVIGLAILGSMIGFFVFLDLGIDPVTATNLGLSMVKGLSFGSVTAMAQLLMFIPVWLKRRDLVGVGTVIAMLSIGYIIEYSALMWRMLIVWELSWMLRLVLLLLGMNVLGVAISVMLVANLGITAYDGLGFAVVELTGGRVSFRTARVAMDMMFVVIGFSLGAPIGIATLVTMCLVGPIVNFYKGSVAKRINL